MLTWLWGKKMRCLCQHPIDLDRGPHLRARVIASFWTKDCVTAIDFHHDCGLWGLEANNGDWERNLRTGNVSMPQGLLFLPRFSFFSWINTVQNDPNTWFISSPEKDDSDNLLSVFSFYHGGEDFQSFFVCHSHWHHSTCFTFFFLIGKVSFLFFFSFLFF